AVQQLGRSHRSNQSSAPVYKLVVSDLGGEKRFCSAVARRLQSLGALTKGDRRAATGQDLQEFNVQTSMGTAALRKVYASIDEGAPLPHFTASGGGLAFDGNAMEDMQASLDFIGLGPGRKEADVTNVGKFLSRLLGLPVNQQNRIFDYFMDTLSHDIAVAEKEGHYSDAIRDLYGDSVVTLQKSEDFYTDPITHATCSVHSLHVDRGMEWEAALSRLQKAQEEPDFKGGFFESKNMVPGRNATGWLMAIQKEGSPGEFQIWRPNTGYTGSALTYEDLKIKYSKRDQEAAERAWRKIYDESKGWDSDRDKGARCFTVRLLAGSLIPVWDQIHDVVQRASARGGAGVTSSQAEMKVVRMTDKTGMHYIGLRLPEGVIKSVKQKLDAHADLLAGKVLKVTLDAKLLALIPTLVVQHLSFPGNYQMTAFVGPGTPTSITVHSYQGQIVLGIPHKGAFINHVPPKGPNGAFVTPSPFYVPVPVQAGDSDVKGAKVEQPTSIDAKALKKAITPAPTMLSFFGAPKKSLPAPLPRAAVSATASVLAGLGRSEMHQHFSALPARRALAPAAAGAQGRRRPKQPGRSRAASAIFSVPKCQAVQALQRLVRQST
ncbi:MAG: strawberry notch C-terminal domain-containing protein, partial [Promethearchaeia archaeon]